MNTLVSDWWCAKHKVLVIQKSQPRVVPPAAKKFGWVWHEENHHWMKPDTNDPIGIQDITDNFLDMGTDDFKYGDEVVLSDDLDNKDITNAVGKFISVDYLTGRTIVEIRGTQYPVDIDDISIPSEDLGSDEDKLRRGRTYTGSSKIAELPFSYIDDGLDEIDLYNERAEEIETTITNQSSYQNARMDKELYAYTRSGYMQINEDLLNGIVSEKAKNIIKYMKPIETSYALYRGTGLAIHEFLNEDAGPVQIGDVIQLKAFTSTSRDPKVAFDFGGMLLELQPSASTRVITLANEDTEYPEYETIIDFTQKFKITKIGEFDDRKVFRGEFLESNQEIQKMISKAVRETPEFARKYGLEFDEDKHRWVHPDTGEEYHHETGELKVSGTKKKNIEERDELENSIEEHPTYVNVRDSMALRFYIGNSQSWALNEALVKGEIWAEAKEIKSLMKPMQSPFTVYRGLTLNTGKFLNDNNEETQIGDTLTLKAFASTTRKPEWAEAFVTQMRDPDHREKSNIPEDLPLFAFLQIQTTSDTLAISVLHKDAGTLINERETILDYGQQLEIIAIEQDDKRQLHVKCRIVSNNNLELQKAMREKPDFAQKYGLEFDEDKHRWINPDTGEVHEHPENDGRHRFKIGQEVISILGNRDVPSKILEFKDDVALVQVKGGYDKWTVSYDKIREKGRKKIHK